MARLVAAMASSHAFAFMEPSTWDEYRQMNRGFYERRYGKKPPEHARVSEETDSYLEQQFAPIRDGLKRLRESLAAARPDALIVIGDDQNENFSEANLPQLAIYVGEQFIASNRKLESLVAKPYRSQSDLAQKLLEGCTDQGFELASLKSFPDDKLIAHAFSPALQILVPEADIPIVLIFVEAIRPPSPTPRRCFELGRAIRKVVDSWEGGERVAVYASGGLSHFTAGFPYKTYKKKYGYDYGSIAEDFDRKALDWVAKGDTQRLSDLTSEELLETGDVELRSWITAAGIVGDGTKAAILGYAPVHRALTGLAVAEWELAPVGPASRQRVAAAAT
jgi:aromatic ring-opening dioxygenase catalytic subunit (LigB family)